MQTYKGNKIKKSSIYGVGKQMGNTIYLHKSVEDKLPASLLKLAQSFIPPNFTYDIIKYDKSNGNITFISSPDWDNAPEPIVGDALLIRGDGTTRFIPQKSNPQIYHHKWLFVDDGYGGFNTTLSKERSKKWVGLPHIEFNKIGYKDYWVKNVIPLIENKMKEIIVEMSYELISPEEIEKANRSSRSSGAVGPNAVTPRMVLQYIKDSGNRDVKILDFGSGKDAKHTYALRELGLDVTAHDFQSNIRDDHHDPHALNRQYDIIFASNVLNVQGSEMMLRRTIQDVMIALKDEGVFIANFPSSPRYYFESARDAKDILEDYFNISLIHGSDGGKSSAPVLAMTRKDTLKESYWK